MKAPHTEQFVRLHRRARIAVSCAVGASTIAVFSMAMVLEPHVRAGVDAALRLPRAIAKEFVSVTSLGRAPAASEVKSRVAEPALETNSHEANLAEAEQLVAVLARRATPRATGRSDHGPHEGGAIAVASAAPEAGAETVEASEEAGVAVRAMAQATPIASSSQAFTEAPKSDAIPTHSPVVPSATPVVPSALLAPPLAPPVVPSALLAPPLAPPSATARLAPMASAKVGPVLPAVNEMAAMIAESSPKSVAVSFAPQFGAIGQVPVIALPLPFWAAAVPIGNSVQVFVKKIKSSKGHVHCAIFAAPGAGFPFQANLAQGLVDVAIDDKQVGSVEYQADCSFTSVPRGTYAVSVYHDENENGRFDRNWSSTPIEGRGASNNAKGGFGPVRFSDAAFAYTAGAQSLSIDMDYLSQ